VRATRRGAPAVPCDSMAVLRCWDALPTANLREERWTPALLKPARALSRLRSAELPPSLQPHTDTREEKGVSRGWE
jgi:hypothetical protein